MTLEYRRAINLLRESGAEVMVSVGATGDEMSGIEGRLGVKLPISYKAMLAEYGNLTFEGFEIFGWTKAGFAASSIPCAIFATESELRKGMISNGMVSIMTVGYGPTIVIDCSEIRDGEAPVYEVQVGGPKFGREKLADSFGAFLLSEVERAIRLFRPS